LLSAFALQPFSSSDAMEFRRSDRKFDWPIDRLILGENSTGFTGRNDSRMPTAWLSYFPSL
jgi:hypothetical protein